MAVSIGVFMIARGLKVQLREWTPNIGMVRDRTSHKVRVNIHELPLQYWNPQGVNHLMSGYDYVDCMSLVIVNGNFKTLRALIACYDPSHIPLSIWLTKNPGSKEMLIEIKGWIHNSLPPLNLGPGDDTGRESSNYGPVKDNGRHRHRGASLFRGRTIHCDHDHVTRSRSTTRGNSVPHRRIFGRNTPATEKNQLKSTVTVQTGEPKVTCVITCVEKKVQSQPQRVTAICLQAWTCVQIHATTDKMGTVHAKLCQINCINPVWEISPCSLQWSPAKQQRSHAVLLTIKEAMGDESIQKAYLSLTNKKATQIIQKETLHSPTERKLITDPKQECNGFMG